MEWRCLVCADDIKGRYTMIFFLFPGHHSTLNTRSDNCDCRHILGMWACICLPFPWQVLSLSVCTQAHTFMPEPSTGSMKEAREIGQPHKYTGLVFSPFRSSKWFFEVGIITSFPYRGSERAMLRLGNSPEAPDEHWCHLKRIPLANTGTNGAWK